MKAPLIDTMNHSSILLKQAKEIILEANKQSSANLGLMKLSKDLRTQLIHESPSQLTLQRSLFENYEVHKLKTRLNKFQVEDLYIKRETGLPMEMLE